MSCNGSGLAEVSEPVIREGRGESRSATLAGPIPSSSHVSQQTQGNVSGRHEPGGDDARGTEGGELQAKQEKLRIKCVAYSSGVDIMIADHGSSMDCATMTII